MMILNNFNDKSERGKELCFDPNAFIDKSFNIDSFLRGHRNKATLENLRDDLGIYLKTLRLSMIELINRDYEDFVNLSKDLVGLNDGIELLEKPLERVRDQVMVVKNSLEEAIVGLSDCLQQARSVRERKEALTNLSQVLTSLIKLKQLVEKTSRSREATLEIIERAGAEFCLVQYSLIKCRTLLTIELKEEAECISKLLINIVNNTFIECLCDQNGDQLARCVRVFVSMDKVSELEKLVLEEVVMPFLHSAVREYPRQKEPTALSSLYDTVLRFTDSQLSKLVAITTEHGSGKVNLIVRSLWTELERRLELDLPSIFSAGEPDIFHAHYLASVSFLNALETRCGSSATAKQFVLHPQTVRFRQKWNLLVYYKIRFQEIAAEMECSACLAAATTSTNQGPFRLRTAQVTLLCLQRCFDPSIFLPDLAHSFWKLSFQILSRYHTWLLEETKKDVTNESIPGSAANRLNLLVNLHCDTATLSSESSSFLSSQDSAKFLEKAMAASLEQLRSGFGVLASSIVAIIVRESLVPLAYVKDIPRLFRRTNRDLPTKPSEYINLALQTPIQFHSNYKETIADDVLRDWIKQAFCEITKHFYSSVNEVLTNAQKTEESLRRLKKAKDRLAENRNVSDDDKIRQQLVLDVEGWSNGAKGLFLSPSEITQMDDLVQLATRARHKSGLT